MFDRRLSKKLFANFPSHFTSIIMTNDTTYDTDTTARLVILKARAAYPCKYHPEVLISSGDLSAETRAYQIARNTMQFHDKKYLVEKISLSVQSVLEQANRACVHCMQYMKNQQARAI